MTRTLTRRPAAALSSCNRQIIADDYNSNVMRNALSRASAVLANCTDEQPRSVLMVNPSRYLKIGPGGRNCNCCFPAPRSKDRRARFRIAKRKAEREAMKIAVAVFGEVVYG